MAKARGGALPNLDQGQVSEFRDRIPSFESTFQVSSQNSKIRVKIPKFGKLIRNSKLKKKSNTCWHCSKNNQIVWK